MIRKEFGQVYLTGQDEVILGTVLFLMNRFLDENNATRRDVDRAIYYFRDLGLPLDEWLFNHILGRWDTRLAWGTPARDITFPLDGRDPAGGESLIYRARRREMWKRMCEAIGSQTTVSAPPWLRNTPEFSGDLPTANAMLTVMRIVLGEELLDRLTDLTNPEPPPANDLTGTSKTRRRMEAIFRRLEKYYGIEVGFRPKKWLNVKSL